MLEIEEKGGLISIKGAKKLLQTELNALHE